MDEADVRKLYQEYIRMLAGAVLAYPGWKRTLLELPIGRRFAINAASLAWLNELIRVGATAGTLAGFPNRTTTHTRIHDGMVIGSVWNEGLRYRHNGRYDGPVGWRFSWRAPATNIGPVRFYAEGTAADRDRTPHGDYSYYLDGIVVNPQPEAR
jgi:hypothetical protein